MLHDDLCATTCGGSREILRPRAAIAVSFFFLAYFAHGVMAGITAEAIAGLEANRAGPGQTTIGQAIPRQATAGQGTPVMVARASQGCFATIVHATGYLVARAEALVEFPLEGYQIAEVLAGEGETVMERQPLVRLVRAAGQATGGQSNIATALPASIVLKAIVPGRIIASTAAVGALTYPRLPPLFRIAIDGRIEADAEVSSIYLDRIAVDQPVGVTPQGEREIGGRVRTIAAAVDPVSQMGHVRIAIEADAGLRAGRFVRAAIDTGDACGLSVPLAAVLRTTEGTSVQIVRGNLVETVRVRVGAAADGRIVVLAGLQEGDAVVAHAGTSLRDGDRVAPEFLEMAAQPRGRH
jgi:HlyD family secretion protein